MKTRIFNAVLPVASFLLAIGFAFATHTGNAGTEDALLVEGYIFQDNECEHVIDCSDDGTIACTFNNMQVYEWNGTTCIRPLTYTP